MNLDEAIKILDPETSRDALLKYETDDERLEACNEACRMGVQTLRESNNNGWIRLYQGDCLELMKDIPDGSVDMVLCDLPYGITQCDWDKTLPFFPLWEQYKRICKQNAPIILFSVQPFTTDLINSNRKMFRYEIIWEKSQKLGFLNAKKMPLRAHENILVFYQKAPTYNPQKYSKEDLHGTKVHNIGKTRKNSDSKKVIGNIYMPVSKETAETYTYTDDGTRYPSDVVHFSSWNGVCFGRKCRYINHPTSKPVPLLEYLIKTYSNEGETVLDNTMGSGSTGVACVNTHRNFIGIELDQGFFETAKSRIAALTTELSKEGAEK